MEPVDGRRDTVVVVTRKTRLEELIERFGTRGQARFYIEHAGGDFSDYIAEDDTYRRALEPILRLDELGLRLLRIDRSMLPTYLFTPRELVIAVGQDGLVANTAKYTLAQPLLGVNPDPTRFDGVLLPFSPERTREAVRRVLAGKAQALRVTLAEAQLADGQRLLAFNDLFIGQRSHVSARYLIRASGRAEAQSSSGVVISTGAGSTGWLSSICTMARRVAHFTGVVEEDRPGSGAVRMRWDDPRLAFVVREPFASKRTGTAIAAGFLDPGEQLVLESLMPAGGVVFSDGIESDFVGFDSGAVARIGAAAQSAQLVVS
jgi:NAD kinase